VQNSKHSAKKGEREDGTILDELADNHVEGDKRPKEKLPTGYNNESLFEIRMTQNTIAKSVYQTSVRKENARSSKEYCTTTSPNNQWNEVYKLASSNTRSETKISTLPKPCGTNSESIDYNFRFVLDKLIPNDNPQDDTDHHRCVRKRAGQCTNDLNDKEFKQ